MPAPKRPSRRTGRSTATVAASVLLALATIAGIACTAVTVSGADRDPGAPVWALPKQTDDSGRGDSRGNGRKAAASGLAGMLLPYGDGWGRGPDLAEHGSDAVFTGREVAELRKESLRDLPRSRREQMEREIDRQHVSGMVMRSYLSTDDIAYTYAKNAFTVSVVLTRMSRAAAKDNARFQSAFMDAFGIFRKGPSIKGHKDAHCFLPPKDAEEDLKSMFCSAYVGEILVTAVADGPASFDTGQAATLLKEQLDRIAEPGEAV
ncbi:hypothetical protein H1R13_11990 [Streptomyces mexicanus]|uniref:Secreted protein n=1 Tax=Streptomyces mexicanus TaxID=178566 RepID=A0A7X1HYU2_9ACTN|nr:hypothetical protein [Streptomyces mexicanus]MBC2865699.1 hypothetical protein [Streptomyces mexicanus]